MFPICVRLSSSWVSILVILGISLFHWMVSSFNFFYDRFLQLCSQSSYFFCSWSLSTNNSFWFIVYYRSTTLFKIKEMEEYSWLKQYIFCNGSGDNTWLSFHQSMTPHQKLDNIYNRAMNIAPGSEEDERLVGEIISICMEPETWNANTTSPSMTSAPAVTWMMIFYWRMNHELAKN